MMTAIKAFFEKNRVAGIGLAIAGLLFSGDGALAAASERTISVGGEQRSYSLYVPSALAQPAPLVFVFHGGGGSAEKFMNQSQMTRIADREHFIAVFPQGVGRSKGGSWNVGGGYSPSNADDVGFVRAILADMNRSFAIDPKRIYATGMSMGAIFSYRLACEMSDTFAAIAPVSGTMVEAGCSPGAPVAVFHVHGTRDENIPFGGGSGAMTGAGRSWPSARDGLEKWAGIDRCAPPIESRKDGADTTCSFYDHCQATVVLCLVKGGGHAWPGSAPKRWQETTGVYVSQNFPASERIWAFFAAHPKP